MSAHIRSTDPERAVRKMNQVLRDVYEIYHTTLQVEKITINGEPDCCDNDN